MGMGMAAGEKIKNVNAGEKNEKLHQKRGKCLKIAPFWTINAKKFWGKKGYQSTDQMRIRNTGKNKALLHSQRRYLPRCPNMVSSDLWICKAEK